VLRTLVERILMQLDAFMCSCMQELVRALAEDKADIHLDPVLYRACAVDLKGPCKEVPRGNGRRKLITVLHT